MENSESGGPTEPVETENEFSNGQTEPGIETPEGTNQNEVAEATEQGNAVNETVDSGKEPDNLSELHQINTELRGKVEDVQVQLEKDTKTLETLKEELPNVKPESLAMSQAAYELQSKIEYIDSRIDKVELGLPNELGELGEVQTTIMQMREDLNKAEGELEKTRKEVLEDWIDQCVEDALKGENWTVGVLDYGENKDEAKKLLKLKLKAFLSEEGEAFLKLQTDELPGWDGSISYKDIKTKDGEKTYITKINIGPYTENFETPEGDGEKEQTTSEKVRGNPVDSTEGGAGEDTDDSKQELDQNGNPQNIDPEGPNNLEEAA